MVGDIWHVGADRMESLFPRGGRWAHRLHLLCFRLAAPQRWWGNSTSVGSSTAPPAPRDRSPPLSMRFRRRVSEHLPRTMDAPTLAIASMGSVPRKRRVPFKRVGTGLMTESRRWGYQWTQHRAHTRQNTMAAHVLCFPPRAYSQYVRFGDVKSVPNLHRPQICEPYTSLTSEIFSLKGDH